eukprot:1159968-Pelagomonas_calceolata.AAC.16
MLERMCACIRAFARDSSGRSVAPFLRSRLNSGYEKVPCACAYVAREPVTHAFRRVKKTRSGADDLCLHLLTHSQDPRAWDALARCPHLAVLTLGAVGASAGCCDDSEGTLPAPESLPGLRKLRLGSAVSPRTLCAMLRAAPGLEELTVEVGGGNGKERREGKGGEGKERRGGGCMSCSCSLGCVAG